MTHIRMLRQRAYLLCAYRPAWQLFRGRQYQVLTCNEIVKPSRAIFILFHLSSLKFLRAYLIFSRSLPFGEVMCLGFGPQAALRQTKCDTARGGMSDADMVIRKRQDALSSRGLLGPHLQVCRHGTEGRFLPPTQQSRSPWVAIQGACKGCAL